MATAYAVFDRNAKAMVPGLFASSADAQKHADRLAAKESRVKNEAHTRDVVTVTV
jgi:hypothetical protein